MIEDRFPGFSGWKTTIRSSFKKKELHAHYIFVSPLGRGVYFLEIDFYGIYRPESDFTGSGDGHLQVGFSAYSTNEKTKAPSGIIEVDFEVSKDLDGASIYGQINKRTWRGVIIPSKTIKKIYDDQMGLWCSFTDKPKRIRLK